MPGVFCGDGDAEGTAEAAGCGEELEAGDGEVPTCATTLAEPAEHDL